MAGFCSLCVIRATYPSNTMSHLELVDEGDLLELLVLLVRLPADALDVLLALLLRAPHLVVEQEAALVHQLLLLRDHHFDLGVQQRQLRRLVVLELVTPQFRLPLLLLEGLG